MNRELQFENEHVCVWKTVISPNEPFETQNQSQVVIGLKGGDLQHKARWLNHKEALYSSDHPVEVMVVEMKQPKDTPLPSKPID